MSSTNCQGVRNVRDIVPSSNADNLHSLALLLVVGVCFLLAALVEVAL